MNALRPLTYAAFLLIFSANWGCSREREHAHDSAPAASASGHAHHADEAEHEEIPTRVRLDPAVVAAAKIQTAPVTRQTLAVTLELPGELTSDPDKTAKLSALVPGRLEAVNFKEGQSVKQGELLAIIKVPELGKTKAAFAATRSKAVAARANLQRLQVLAEKRLAAEQELLAAKAETEALEVEASAAEEQLRALGTSTGGAVRSQLALRAPLSGVVLSRDAIVGQPVSADQIIATIADLSEVWFLGRVFEKNLSQVRVGAPAEIQLNAYPKERFVGAVDYLSQQIDPTARTLIARIRLTNRDSLLRLGLFGVAQVGTGDDDKRRPVLVVPRSALTEIGGKPVVFVRQADGDFDLHHVVLGEGALGKVEVVSGLREGEQVVVDGVFTLKSTALRATFGEEGH